MSASGFVGFVIDGTEKIAYNHDCSGPKHLGTAVLEWLHRSVTDLDTVTADTRALQVIGSDNPGPSPQDIQRLQPWTDLRVGMQSTSDWYCLLRGSQGRIGEILRAGYLEDASDFPIDGLWAEWGYLVDLDTRTLEVYRGLQRKPHSRGRFVARPASQNQQGCQTYYPAALVAAWPLTVLPSRPEFLARLDGNTGV